nr:PREDICTED: nicotinamide riboside kinase 2-like [Bemisia tabaci]XP_018914576.1 PREDICTED: nicotinamide riboside kinase 2-like [Bemisia tabaci]
MVEDDMIRRSDEWCVLGITGIGRSGKSTLAKKLEAKIPGSYAIHQDDYFHPLDYEGHEYVTGLGESVANWEIISSIDFDSLLSDVRSILNRYDPPENPVLIIEGHLVLNEPRLNSIVDKRICLTMDKEECWERRKHVDYGNHDSKRYFNLCGWPEYQKRLSEMKQMNDRAKHNNDRIKFIHYSTDFDKLVDELIADAMKICEIKSKSRRKKTSIA